MAEEKRFRIGYALAPKKQNSFIRDSLVSLARSRGIDLVRVDPYIPLSDQGPFDCVLHKLHGEDWKRQLNDFTAKHPNVVVLDSPESIERLHNRISMLQVVSELDTFDRSETFGIPKQTVIHDRETLSDRRSWEGLRFPVIAKPLVADGSAKSHKMALVFNRDGLDKLNPPIVLQEFVNHGGVIFKVYVVGEHVKCVKRKSLPDVEEDELVAVSEDLLSFSQVSNLATDERIDEYKYYKKMHLDDAEMPPLCFITHVARGLRHVMKLNLFNFDVIRDSRFGNRYLIIDINYFPGYAKMPGYESVLTDFFCDVLCKKQKVMMSLGENTRFDRCSSNLVHGYDKESRKIMSNTCCGDGDEGSLQVSTLSSMEEKESAVQNLLFYGLVNRLVGRRELHILLGSSRWYSGGEN